MEEIASAIARMNHGYVAFSALLAMACCAEAPSLSATAGEGGPLVVSTDGAPSARGRTCEDFPYDFPRRDLSAGMLCSVDNDCVALNLGGSQSTGF